MIALSPEAEAVLGRLASGDRLIAFTARGVSWQGNIDEYPDSNAIHELLELGAIERKSSTVGFGSHIVTVLEYQESHQ